MKHSSRLLMSRFRSCNPIHENVTGAPFRVGQTVRVCQLVDETGLRKFLARKGTVEHLEYSCGCGQSFPFDPMIGVRFANGELEEFWPEELNPAPMRRNAGLQMTSLKLKGTTRKLTCTRIDEYAGWGKFVPWIAYGWMAVVLVGFSFWSWRNSKKPDSEW